MHLSGDGEAISVVLFKYPDKLRFSVGSKHHHRNIQPRLNHFLRIIVKLLESFNLPIFPGSNL